MLSLKAVDGAVDADARHLHSVDPLAGRLAPPRRPVHARPVPMPPDQDRPPPARLGTHPDRARRGDDRLRPVRRPERPQPHAASAARDRRRLRPGSRLPGTDDGCGGSQLVDIYRSGQPGPNPVLVYFHGGGFVGGDKVGSISAYLTEAMDDGWDIVSASPRPTAPTPSPPRSPTPSGWCAGSRPTPSPSWDAQNVAAMGHSAGGNLAGMLAVTAEQAEFDATDLPADLPPNRRLGDRGDRAQPRVGPDPVRRQPDWTESMQHHGLHR